MNRATGGTVSYAPTSGVHFTEEDCREAMTTLSRRGGLLSYVADSRRPKEVLMTFVRTEIISLEDANGNRRTETIQTPMEATFVLKELREAR